MLAAWAVPLPGSLPAPPSHLLSLSHTSLLGSSHTPLAWKIAIASLFKHQKCRLYFCVSYSAFSGKLSNLTLATFNRFLCFSVLKCLYYNFTESEYKIESTEDTDTNIMRPNLTVIRAAGSKYNNGRKGYKKKTRVLHYK